VLTKNEKEMINDLKGHELYWDSGIVGIEYPYIWDRGVKKRLTEGQWKKLLKGYFNDPLNEGYWILKDSYEEFGK